MVVTEGDPANPTTLLTKQQRGAAFTSSYDEKKAAMRMALEWLLPSHAAAAICTDSQSLLKAILSGSADTTDLWRMLNKRAGKTTLLSIPGHHRIAGNEETDACAKQAAAIADGAPRPVSYAAASALIRRTLTDPPPCHCRTKEVYTKAFSWPAVGLSPRGAMLFSSPVYEPVTPPSLRLTPTSSTPQSWPIRTP